MRAGWSSLGTIARKTRVRSIRILMEMKATVLRLVEVVDGRLARRDARDRAGSYKQVDAFGSVDQAVAIPARVVDPRKHVHQDKMDRRCSGRMEGEVMAMVRVAKAGLARLVVERKEAATGSKVVVCMRGRPQGNEPV